MCRCNPSVRTPFCGRPGCEWPKQEPARREWKSGLSLPELQRLVHAWARSKGWWEDADRNFGELMALAHSELSEALEEWRIHGMTGYEVEGKPEGIGVELADCVIRLLDTCAAYGIDLEFELLRKMRYNEGRPHMGRVPGGVLWLKGWS